jgi:aminomethyltransferase
VAGAEAYISRTGYTGEDGFEIYCSPEEAPKLWDAIFEAGKPFGLQPAGLGCRDTLRFEASMPLYGQEMDDTHGPIEALLRRFVYFKKPDFIGREALYRKHTEGTEVKLVGFEMVGRGIARTGYPIVKDGEKVGYVTTGSYAPTLDKNLGMGFVKSALTGLDTEFDIEIRGRGVKAKVVKMPFYKRGAQ